MIRAVPDPADDSHRKPPALDPFGFPLRWSIETRREIRRVRRALTVLPEHTREALAAGREAADRVVATEPAEVPDSALAVDTRVVLALPFPITTGGMRVQMQLARMLVSEGAEVHVRQVRGADCLDERYEDFGFASRAAVGGPRKLTGALQELGPSTIIAGCFIDYFAALEAGTGPLIGYSAGEPTLKETEPFDQDFLDFVRLMHRLPVTLWAGSRFIQNVYQERFGRCSKLLSVPIAAEMYGRSFPSPPPRPFRIVLIGPESLTTKGIPGALEALSPLRNAGCQVVWITPEAPSDGMAVLADEVLVRLGPEEIARTVSGCHALVFPSRLEGLGNPPLEAMALGVPAVLCPNGGSDEYAVSKENCLLVPYGDADRLRAAVLRLREEPELAGRLREHGLATAERYRPTTIQHALRSFMSHATGAIPGPVFKSEQPSAG